MGRYEHLDLKIGWLPGAEGNCDDCGEALDHDRQSIAMSVNDGGEMFFHQVCAWKRATFVFGELF